MRSRGAWGWILAGLAALLLLGPVFFHNVLASALLNRSANAELPGALRWSRLARLVASGETRRRVVTLRANQLECLDDFTGALEEIEGLSDPWTRLTRSRLLTRLDRDDEALEELGRVEAEGDANLARPLLFYGAQIYEKRGERERARSAYLSVAALGERNEWGRRALQKAAELRD